MTPCRSRSCAGVVALALSACGSEAPPHPRVDVARTWLSPAADVGAACADLTDLRVCWRASGAPEVEVVTRTVPPRPAPTPAGFRCAGQGEARTCSARDDAGPFVCEGGTCTQRHPRQPDDGQWQCADDSGVSVCTGGEPAAGTVRTEPAPGWICGARAAAQGRRAGERVCVDLSPDFPSGSAHDERCRWSYERGPSRSCTRDPGAHALGDACGPKDPCVAGALCVAGRCVPPRPAADCATDGDCSGGRCRFGSCSKGSP